MCVAPSYGRISFCAYSLHAKYSTVASDSNTTSIINKNYIFSRCKVDRLISIHVSRFATSLLTIKLLTSPRNHHNGIIHGQQETNGDELVCAIYTCTECTGIYTCTECTGIYTCIECTGRQMACKNAEETLEISDSNRVQQLSCLCSFANVLCATRLRFLIIINGIVVHAPFVVSSTQPALCICRLQSMAAFLSRMSSRRLLSRLPSLLLATDLVLL